MKALLKFVVAVKPLLTAHHSPKLTVQCFLPRPMISSRNAIPGVYAARKFSPLFNPPRYSSSPTTFQHVATSKKASDRSSVPSGMWWMDRKEFRRA